MRHLKIYDMINEGWQTTLKRELSFGREDDIRHYFLDVVDDLGWKELPVRNRICDDTFDIKDSRTEYVSRPIFQRYTFTFERSRGHKLSMDAIIETMEDITEAIERLRSDGYFINIDLLTVGNSIAERFEISVYHPDDAISWDLIFISKDKR